MATAVAILHRDEIIKLAATGAKLSEIAGKFGITPSGISQQLSKDPEYLAARETAAELRLDGRERELETCEPDSAEISRARELLSHQRWRCEREFPHRWGNRTQVSIDQRVTVDIAMTDDLKDALGHIRTAAQLPQSNTVHNEVEDAQLIDDPED